MMHFNKVNNKNSDTIYIPKKVILISAFITIFVIYGSLFTINKLFKPPAKVDYTIKPVLIDTNKLGCNKYRYYDDKYWVCPKNLEISSIEEQEGKDMALTPVLEGNEK